MIRFHFCICRRVTGPTTAPVSTIGSNMVKFTRWKTNWKNVKFTKLTTPLICQQKIQSIKRLIKIPNFLPGQYQRWTAWHSAWAQFWGQRQSSWRNSRRFWKKAKKLRYWNRSFAKSLGAWCSIDIVAVTFVIVFSKSWFTGSHS